MDSIKLTGWFPPEIKPVNDGVYRVYERVSTPEYALWRGGEWSMSACSKDGNFEFLPRASHAYKSIQNKDWCGVLK